MRKLQVGVLCIEVREPLTRASAMAAAWRSAPSAAASSLVSPTTSGCPVSSVPPRAFGRIWTSGVAAGLERRRRLFQRAIWCSGRETGRRLRPRSGDEDRLRPRALGPGSGDRAGSVTTLSFATFMAPSPEPWAKEILAERPGCRMAYWVSRSVAQPAVAAIRVS